MIDFDTLCYKNRCTAQQINRSCIHCRKATR